MVEYPDNSSLCCSLSSMSGLLSAGLWFRALGLGAFTVAKGKGKKP